MPFTGLPAGGAFARGFDSVIGGVAYQVSQRLGQRVQNAFIEIRVLAGDFETQFLC